MSTFRVVTLLLVTKSLTHFMCAEPTAPRQVCPVSSSFGLMLGDGWFTDDPAGLAVVRARLDAGVRLFRLPYYQHEKSPRRWNNLLDVYQRRADVWTLALLVPQSAYDRNDRPGTVTRFLEYVREVADDHRRSARRNVIYELWNEPDAGHYLSPVEFADLMSRGLAVLRGVWGDRYGKDILVCSGGVAGIDTDPRAYWHAALAELAKQPVKPHFFGYHCYRLDDSARGRHVNRPEFLIDEPNRKLTLLEAIRTLREKVNQHGMDLLMTERGFEVSVNDDRLRAAYLVRMALMHLGESIEGAVWDVDMPPTSKHTSRLPREAYPVLKRLIAFFPGNPKDDRVSRPLDWSSRIRGDCYSIVRDINDEVHLALWIPESDFERTQPVTVIVPKGYCIAHHEVRQMARK